MYDMELKVHSFGTQSSFIERGSSPSAVFRTTSSGTHQQHLKLNQFLDIDIRRSLRNLVTSRNLVCILQPGLSFTDRHFTE